MENNDMHSVQVVVEEGRAFIKRNHLDGEVAEIGGMTWGLLRAVLECPNCPGHYRVPQDDDWQLIICPNCKHAWTYRPTEAQPVKRKRR